VPPVAMTVLPIVAVVCSKVFLASFHSRQWHQLICLPACLPACSPLQRLRPGGSAVRLSGKHPLRGGEWKLVTARLQLSVPGWKWTALQACKRLQGCRTQSALNSAC
jgi:hypothetical protein